MTFPNIDDINFQKKVADKFKKYIIKKNPSFKELCFPESFKLQKPQLFVSEFINPKTPYKGLLIFHRIGAGKTCAAIRIAEECKHKKKIIVVLPASLLGNFYKELRSECTGDEYVNKKEREQLYSLHPITKEYRTLLDKINKRIEKYYEIYSYNKYVELYEKKKLDLKNSLIIVDEVQNIVSETGKYYKLIKKSIDNSSKSTKVVLLSATPIFDKPVELALTLNLLKLDNPIPIGNEFNNLFLEKIDNTYKLNNQEELKKMMQGLISFYPGAPVYAFPRMNFKVVKCNMSNYQYKSYLALENRQSDNIFKDILKLPNDFLLGPRMISNIAYPNRLISQKGYENFKDSHIENLKKYSIKFYKIIKKIQKCDGTIFIYSNFKEYGGLESLIKVLKYYGYKNFLDDGMGKNRFAIWSGNENIIDKDLIRDIFNSKKNVNGSLIKIILGSPAIKEGVSLLRVKDVHILEPYWNISRLDQVIGRAIRFCSHRDVEKKDRYVNVYLYLATAPKDIKNKTVDEHIYNLALKKKELTESFIELIKDVAVDKYLFQLNTV